MNDVKDILPEHLGRLFARMRACVAELTVDGLRFSHLRVLEAVPDAGASVTDLAERLGMTKQGCGQFVAQLVTNGLVRTEAPEADRRVRVVRRTAAGDRLLARSRALMAATEERFAAEVGPRRYATFRRVLEDLTGTSGT